MIDSIEKNPEIVKTSTPPSSKSKKAIRANTRHAKTAATGSGTCLGSWSAAGRRPKKGEDDD